MLASKATTLATFAGQQGNRNRDGGRRAGKAGVDLAVSIPVSRVLVARRRASRWAWCISRSAARDGRIVHREMRFGAIGPHHGA